MARHTWTLAALATAALLAACGSGGADAPGNRAGITSVMTMGDSLVAVGYRAANGTRTINSVNASSDEPNVIWTERINYNLGLGSTPLCSYYPESGSTNNAACNSLAISGARIVNLPIQGTPVGIALGYAPPSQTVLKQLDDAAAKVGTYDGQKILLLDGGGNDAADVITVYLALNKALPSPALVLSTFKTTLAGSLQAAGANQAAVSSVASAADAATAGVAYMTAVGNLLTARITSQALNKGLTRVAFLNLPAVELTPRLKAVVGTLPAATGAAVNALAKAWVDAFNGAFTAGLGSDSRVSIVDFNAEFRRQVATPEQYALTNVTTPACPPTGQDAQGATYDFKTCTQANLDAQAGKTAGWWKNYAFSDGFHPTPYGHQLISQLVSVSLAQKGWQ